ncbi:MAG: divalent-cation tolerance protein CutA [Candidatus Tectomicrobia bacterium]|uniref:Divalent-cation tolerance protein CutA n=1 Tax=Tectimicrobiota bacterium TaxID=2528274 RepID=A0A932M1Y4_UNCTE|nr:divalent-cation tolerance protein CutA [Candidatus Tectomicrobia bacterium]
MGEQPEVVLIFSTVGSREEGERIATALIERKEAACVNLVPGLTSIYSWEGKLCRQEEVLLLVKTLRRRIPDVIEIVRRLHSYQVPEIIAVSVTDGLPEYLKWVVDEAGGPGG